MPGCKDPYHAPLDRSVLGTSKGVWVIRVRSQVATEDQTTVRLELVLEKRPLSSPSECRILCVVAPGSDLAAALSRAALADRIRNWVETTEADGILDLVSEQEQRGSTTKPTC